MSAGTREGRVAAATPQPGGQVTVTGVGWLHDSLTRVGAKILAPLTGTHRTFDEQVPDAARPTLTVVILDDDPGDPAALPGRVERLAPGDAGVRLCVVLRGDEVDLGPLDGAPGQAGLADMVGRVIAAGPVGPGLTPGGTPPAPWADDQLAWLAVLLADELTRFLAARECRASDHLVTLDRRDRSVRRHPVLPLPTASDQEADSLPAAAVDRDPAALLDPRTGIVTGIYRYRHHPSIPAQVTTMHATVANMRRISPWITDPVAGGSAFDDPEGAYHAALGEAVERYSGEIVQRQRLRQASWNELTAAGAGAVDPDSLVLFSDQQHATPGFPFVPLARNLRVHWVPGHCLTTGLPAWLPASLVYPNWYTGGYETDPHTNNPFYPGLAAGRSLESALASGIQEVVERHATMVWWANAQPLPALRQTSRLRSLWRGEPERRGQRAWLVHLDNEFGIPVFAGMLENSREQLFTMGFAARPDPEAAALGRVRRGGV
jgi:hypothetical protein